MSPFPSIPTATCRLQFHQGFRFADAQNIVPYLRDLGITHIYASPIFRASQGSLHGYDICDHNELNPELGNRDDFDSLTEEMRKYGLKLILDFVPNHMGITEGSNLWWMDVLENGPSSCYASYFDIDWKPLKRELESKVLLPILGEQYGRTLEGGKLFIEYDQGSFCLRYEDRYLPLAVHSLLPVLERVVSKLHLEEADVPVELESIMFAIEHLPYTQEALGGRMAELVREKEVIRTRMMRLCEEHPEVTAAIATALEDFNTGGEHKNFDPLDALISAQHYRLASWRVAAEEINYRRFFDVNTLVALQMHLPEVFAATHQLVGELLKSDVVTGLRIDHIDGLRDPHRYLTLLQECHANAHEVNPESKPLYLLVEKILGRDENLREDWPVHGTTGYEFATQVIDVLIDSDAEAQFTQTYRRFTGMALPYSEFAYRGKLLVMRAAMASEVNVLAHQLSRIAETNRWYRDFTLEALGTALREIIACFQVYRTYITPEGEISHEDHRIILRAIAMARRKNAELERTVFEFIRDVLLPPADNPHPVDENARRLFVLKLQQCTGAITAKGVEDTAFYAYTRLVALNEVGGEPGHFGSDVERFHQQNKMRGEKHPHCMLATSTHDTKRSEDVRARIAALSEMPREWARAVRTWHRANRKFAKKMEDSAAPDLNEEYFLYQTLLGSWPLYPMSEEERQEYIGRICHYMVKSLHEAKINSSWIEPNLEWDNAVSVFVERILTPAKNNSFETSFLPLSERVAELGAFNALTQLVLKLTSPGVPDVYQGQELWDFSLVDPDNRRPVDFNLRKSMLEESFPTPEEMLSQWRDGRIKLFITQKLLHLRQQHFSLFASGCYDPLKTSGIYARNVIAYRRGDLVVVVPRLISQVGTPPVGDCWQDTSVEWEGLPDLFNVFTGGWLASCPSMPMSQLLKVFPVGVFITKESPH
ncbi:(1-_4)-alpha-D-glucan 1-alpha-D-glucosylmutase [Prosthecobacter fusiformis]|uniref:(1->4)-alpha-D-glucan 1-alpha-D-glucosylmutase n=1 Tax=Prosthecobacter fusiformis TaxID=48464 RepID=A0A4R7S775_9BACT|nr:malto-oligosyltrehalose synthase [Prosthecobacter fusiformis]TDU73335.1 (1->4)-alpha-D-glucan 1-alpha-D-glucosylmutase [Prosthecobacter fusiformis]